MSGTTLGEALRAASSRIDRLDARVLLAHAVGRDAAYLIAHSDERLDEEGASRYAALVQRRAAGEPVAYLTGEREFFGRSFGVTPAVLIPRPESEHLVELALERIRADGAERILDLGTGSGCIAITLALERPRASVVAADSSTEALDVARANAIRLGAANTAFVESDWYSALGGQHFGLIVANPPYVAPGDRHLNEGDLRYEPTGALEAPGEGLACIRAIVAAAPTHLNAGGWLLLEHGYDQAFRVRELLEAHGFTEVFSARDLAGIERVSGGRLHA